MKINSVPGEFAFKALIRESFGWKLTEQYFLTETEVEELFISPSKSQYKWPVEVQDGEIVYVPSEEELK